MCLQMENRDFCYTLASFLCGCPAFPFFPASCSHQRMPADVQARGGICAPWPPVNMALNTCFTSVIGRVLVTCLVAGMKFLGKISLNGEGLFLPPRSWA